MPEIYDVSNRKVEKSEGIKWYKKDYFYYICFASIIFAPIGIFLIWKFKKWNFRRKFFLSLVSFTSVFCFAFSFYLFSGSGKNEISAENLDLPSKPSDFKIYEDSKNKVEEKTLPSEDESQGSGANLKSKEKSKNKINSKKEKSNSESESFKKESKKEAKIGVKNKNANIVYITKNGKKYHYKNPCGKGEYIPININEAIKKGYTPCKKCAAK